MRGQLYEILNCNIEDVVVHEKDKSDTEGKVLFAETEDSDAVKTVNEEVSESE